MIVTDWTVKLIEFKGQKYIICAKNDEIPKLISLPRFFEMFEMAVLSATDNTTFSEGMRNPELLDMAGKLLGRLIEGRDP